MLNDASITLSTRAELLLYSTWHTLMFGSVIITENDPPKARCTCMDSNGKRNTHEGYFG